MFIANLRDTIYDIKIEVKKNNYPNIWGNGAGVGGGWIMVRKIN